MRFIAALAFDMLYHARALNEGTGRLFGNREAKFVRKTLCPYLAGTRTPTFIELSTLWHMIKHTPDLPFKLTEPKSAVMPCMAIEQEGRLYLFKYFWSGLSATLWSRYCNSMKGYKVELFEFGNGDRLVYETVDIDYDNISFLKVLGFEVQTDYKRVTSLPQIDAKDLDKRLFPYQVKGVQMLQSGFRLMADEQGLGKALTLDTRIPTPTGWTTMGALQVGDRVFDDRGLPTVVTHTYYHKDKNVYRVTFSDGATVDCCEDHLWQIHDQHGVKVVPLKWFLQKDQFGTVRKDRLKDSYIWKYYIPKCAPVQYDAQPVPFDAYVMGALLGDGCLSRPSILFTTADTEMLDLINARLADGYHLRKRIANVYDYCLTSGKSGYNLYTKGVRELGLKGTKSDNKFIPDCYKYNTVDVRRDVLRGLLDTDGYATKDGIVEFCSVSKQLAEDVRFLAESLGCLCHFSSKVPKCNGKACATAYVVRIKCDCPVDLFLLTRKRALLPVERHFKPRRNIVSIEYVGVQDVKCITVNSPTHLYLCDHFVVTHNTAQTLQFLKLNNPNKVLICCPATLKFNWKREILMWTDYKENEISILSGATPYRVTTRFSIINYDILPYWEKSLSESRYSFIVCDECFVAGTRVRVRGGYRNIEDLHVGDEVLSCSRYGVLEYKKVTAVKAQPKTMDFCTITDASGNNVTCTGNHRFFTSYTDTCEARSLQEGDYIISYNRTTHNEEVNDDRCATGVAWDLARRWLDTVSIQGCLESKACGEPLLEELRLCYEKIRALEGLVQEPVSERDSEHGMGRGTYAVYNKLLSAYEGISRAVLRWYEESDTSRGIESDERRGFSLLVYGRWLIQWYALLAQLRLYASGERDASEVVDGTLWSYSEDTVQQDEGLLLPVDACGEPCTVPAYDREVRGSVYDVQDCLSSKLYNEGMCGLWKAVSSSKEVNSDLFTRLFAYLCGESVDGVVQKTEIVEKHTEFTTRTVYDITVEDNHNFFAEDMLVHNCHYIQNDTAQRTRAFLSIAKSADDVIFISGTPFTSRPFQMYTALHTIAPKVFKSQRDYGERFCCPQIERGKTVYKGASNMDVLHSILMDGICIRRLKEDVLQELPSKRRLTIPIGMTFDEVRKDEIIGNRIKELESNIAKCSDTFGTLTYQRQIACLRKMRMSIDWIRLFLESGKKLVVFGIHKETLNALSSEFGSISVRIDGSTPQNQRQDAIDSFQNDSRIKLFIGSLFACNTGITLTAASDVLFMEMDWCASTMTQAEDRIHRVGQRNACTAWYTICPESIDESMINALNEKAKTQGRILDGIDDVLLPETGTYTYKYIYS